jgi:hypothetical protein
MQDQSRLEQLPLSMLVGAARGLSAIYSPSRKLKEAILSAATSSKGNALSPRDAYHFLVMIRPRVMVTADDIKPVGMQPRVMQELIAALLPPSEALSPQTEDPCQNLPGLQGLEAAVDFPNYPQSTWGSPADAIGRDFTAEWPCSAVGVAYSSGPTETSATTIATLEAHHRVQASGESSYGSLEVPNDVTGSQELSRSGGADEACSSEASPCWALSEYWHMAVAILAENGLPQQKRHAAVKALADATDWSLPGKLGVHSKNVIQHKPKSLACAVLLAERLHAPKSVLWKLLDYAACKPLSFYVGFSNSLPPMRAILGVAARSGAPARLWKLLQLTAQLPVSAFLETDEDELRGALILAIHSSKRDPAVVHVCNAAPVCAMSYSAHCTAASVTATNDIRACALPVPCICCVEVTCGLLE